MEALSWFKFCPARWNMGKTKRLSLEEKAEYLELCCAYWVGGCVMGLDDMKEHTDLVDLFVRRGLVDDDGITWLNVQLAEASVKSDQAKRAASIRWGKREESERNADAMRPHTDRNATAYQTQCVRNAEEREEIEREEREIEREAQQVADSLEFDSDGNEVEQPTTNQPETQKEKVPPKRKKVEVVMPWESEAFTEAWELWKRYKKEEHRFGYKSAISEQGALKKLAEISHGQESSAIKIIHNAIENGWKGLFATTEKQSNNGKRQPVTEDIYNNLMQWASDPNSSLD